MVVPDRNTTWRHTVTGREFTVLEPEPHTLDQTADAHPKSDSEPFVYVSTDDYDEYDRVWLARRLFDTQLEQIDA